jgi:iron complex outermembrane receptor protein
VQLYALAARGFQFGGAQIAPASGLAVSAAQGAGFTFGTYKSSKLWNYESGIRTEWLDRCLRFDLAFFYLDWRDLQLSVQINVPGTNAPFYGFIANVGRAHSEGVESALEVIPFTGARWTSSAAWILAVTDELFDTQNADGGVKPGARMPGTPRFQWSNVVSYEHGVPYFDSWTIGPVLTHSHVGSSPDAIRPTGTVGGYDTLDARFALLKPDSRFLPELSLGVNNLTDVRGVTYHLFIPASTPSGVPVDLYHFIPPRTAVLSLSLKY